MYGKTCLNRSCSKVETLLRRTVTVSQTRFILPVFYMLSFHSFLKQKTVKRTLLQTDNISSPQIKKHPALRRHKNFRNSRREFCQFSQKETFFYTSEQHFFISICSFEGVQHFWLELAISCSKLPSATNQQLFLRH